MRRIYFLLVFTLIVVFSGCGRQIGQKMSDMGDFAFFNLASESAPSSYDMDSTVVPEEIGVQIGMIAPDFDIILPNGESYGKLSDLKGKPVFLNFWATWCGPCVAEMPDIQSIYDKYGEEVHVLALNVGEDEKTVLEFVEKGGYTFKTPLDIDFSIQRQYSIQSIPQTFILDNDGIIVEHIQFSANEKLFTSVLNPLLEQ